MQFLILPALIMVAVCLVLWAKKDSVYALKALGSFSAIIIGSIIFSLVLAYIIYPVTMAQSERLRTDLQAPATDLANQDKMAYANYDQNAPVTDEAQVINNFDQARLRANDPNKGFRVIPANEITAKFTDVAGLYEAKDQIKEIIEFLQDPETYSRLGARLPKGVLLYGRPGTGKTLLARAIAGEAGVNFIPVAGSEFDEEFVGVGASRVRQLFEVARNNAPCIIFIDEIDALAHKRHPHDPAWLAQTVNQLLTEMDGMDPSKNNGVVVIGASNRIQAIDPAVLRPGRLDRHIKLEIPNLGERAEVLSVHLRDIKLNPEVTPQAIAQITSGFSGAELANLVNEAALAATKARKPEVGLNDFVEAKNRVVQAAQKYEQAKNSAQDLNKGVVVLRAQQMTTKFSDLAGLKEVKDEIKDIVDYLHNPNAFGRLGAKPPKGILLYGEPGTGKTMLARAIAGEASANFIAVTGSEFEEEYVGTGAARVRQLFEIARANAPCIIFIDEIDALAYKRSERFSANWTAQTINQLLTEMDGLDPTKNAGVIVIGATNRMQLLDPAVLRPGRLDRMVHLEIPTLSEREEVLGVYFKKVKVNPKITLAKIAKITTGFSSAELANLVNEAAILATKANKEQIDMLDFEQAKERIILGSKRAALKVSNKVKRVTAYHEAGHALVGYLLGTQHTALYKVTIAPRGATLGHTSFEPAADQYSTNLQELEGMIATSLGGRIAEELVFGEDKITTGAEHDLQHATEIAYNMVTHWGYSKRVGLIYNPKDHAIISQEVIEQEVQAIIQRIYDRTKKQLENNRDKLDKIAKALIERETLDAQEIKVLLKPSQRIGK